MSQAAATQTDFIEVYDNVLTPEFCQTLIDRFNRDTRQHPGRTGHGVDRSKKHSLDITLSDHEDWQAEVAHIQQAIFEPLCRYMHRYYFLLIGALSPTVLDPVIQQNTTLDASNYDRLGGDLVSQLVNHMYRAGRLNMQKYLALKGNYNHWHSEIFPQNGSTEPLHRVLLYQFYLNDVADGGHTNFFYQGRQIQPSTGRLIIAPAGFTHTHRGEVPISGDKYILTSWVLFKPAEDLYAAAS